MRRRQGKKMNDFPAFASKTSKLPENSTPGRSMKQIALRLIPIFVALFSLAAYAQQGEGALNPAPPNGISVDEAIHRFAAKEKEFKDARENYTYRQTVKIETLDGNTVDGEYEQVQDVTFDDKNRRIENVVFAPQPTLQRIIMTKEDVDDIRNRLPFVLTSDEIPQYQINYVGQQNEDELHCYVFDIAPKTIEKGQRYFQGRIWVDDHDFQIVKTSGMTVPQIRPKKGQENLFPKFTTWREQVDGRYWFPTYTRADDVLHFNTGDVHVREIIKYSNYKRFGSKVRITYEGQDLPGAPGASQPNTPGGGQQPQSQPQPQSKPQQ
jgi:hypothetical protein